MDEKNLPISNIKELFERIKTMNKLNNDKECWELLEMSKSQFYAAKKKENHLSNDKASQIASKAFLSVESVLVLINREKAVSMEEKIAWDRIISGQGRIMDIMSSYGEISAR